MTDKQYSELMLGLIVLVDSREKVNQHVLEYFDRNKINYRVTKLDHADYSFEFTDPNFKHYDRKVAVERKAHLDEINNNFTKDRDRFHREFQRAEESGTKIHLVVENATWKKIVNESYRSKISSASVTASILSFSIRYKCPVWFVGKDESPMLIYKLLIYGIREMVYRKED
jgi:ERCC4-type nuclease